MRAACFSCESSSTDQPVSKAGSCLLSPPQAASDSVGRADMLCPSILGGFGPDSVLIMRRRRRPVFLRDRKDTACGAVARPMRYFDLPAKVVGPSGARPLGALATLRRLALVVAAGIEPLAAIPLCGSPWRQPRNPARHIGPKALVLRAECLLERRFFVHHHKDMKKKPE
jgi:hypothetical protein